jgi:predicted acylesterase/phospholipase RssA/CRP-like cAMP-binding protein
MPNFSGLINKYSIVKQIPIFSKLNWFELHQVAVKSEIIPFKKGDIICREGNPADGFYCLISGRLQAFMSKENGRRETVEFIFRGMYFGIISLLTGEKHSLTFEALNDSVILKISKDDFQGILKMIPRLGLELSHSLSRRVRSHRMGTKSVFESTIISVYSPVKGSGSSTYAVNLALGLQRETKRKGIFVNICSESEEQKHTSTGDVQEAAPQWKKKPVQLKEIIGDHEKISASVAQGELGLGLLNVCFDPADSFIIEEIGQFVSALAYDYHYVVVDLPNSMDDIVFQTLMQSDTIHLVTLDREDDLRLTRQVIGRLRQNLKSNFISNRIQVMVCNQESKCYLSYEQLNRSLDYDVITILPHIDRAQLNVASVSENMTVITPSLNSEYIQVVTRMARRIGGVLIGLALGGGAALGMAHIGVLKVLEEENIPVDVVAGSSMGALIAALWVTGRNSAQLMEIAWSFKKKKALLKLIDPIFPKAALMGGRAIKLWLRRYIGDQTFYSTRIPLKILAYDLIRREELVLHSGSILDAVRKSIAIPGVINPVLEGERVIIDGGVLNPLPTNVLSAMGIKKIIAVNVLQSPEHVSQGFEQVKERLAQQASVSFWRSPGQYLGVRTHRLMNKIFSPNISDIIIQSLQATEYVIAEQSASQADVLIHPDLTGINWFELYRVEQLIKAGEDAARAQLAKIRQLVSE